MTRWLAISLLLAGCTPPKTDTVYGTDGKKIDIAYLVLAPLCLIFCNTSVATTGSDSDVVGSGTAQSTQSTTQTTSQTGGSR